MCQAPLGLRCVRDVQGGGTILRLVDAMNAAHAGRELFSGGRRGLPQITLPAAKPRRGVRQWAAGPSPVHVSGAGALLGRLATTEQGTGGLRPLRQRQDRPGPAAGVGKSKLDRGASLPFRRLLTAQSPGVPAAGDPGIIAMRPRINMTIHDADEALQEKKLL